MQVVKQTDTFNNNIIKNKKIVRHQEQQREQEENIKMSMIQLEALYKGGHINEEIYKIALKKMEGLIEKSR